MDIIGNVKERARNVNKKQLFMVFLLFLLAFGVRGHLMKYDMMFGFDSYYHARIVSYVIEDGSVPQYDPLAYYWKENSTAIGQTKTQFFWYFSAALYKLFTLNAPYDKDLWIAFVKFLPAFYGALIAVAMFFLGKEMYGRKAGMVMGFFSALVPSFVYRTMAGFFEEDSLGFLWLVIGFYFLVKALKNPKFNRAGIINATVAGLFFAIMAWTWEMFLLVPLVLLAYAFWTVILMWFRKEDNAKIFDFVKLFVISIVIFAALASFVHGQSWIDNTMNYVTQYAPVTQTNIDRASSRGEGILSQTVGEESLGNRFFGEKYNALIIFPYIAFILIPYRLLRRKGDRISLIIFFWALLTFYMAWHKLKFTYTFGLPIAACAGLIFAEVYELMKNRPNFEKMFFSAAFGFMMLIAIGVGPFFVSTKPPNIETTPGWLEALTWIKDNTPEDAKIFNWWDEGHWIAFVAERGVITDNRNLEGTSNKAYGMAMVAEDENTTYYYVNEMKSDYVIIGSDLMRKMSSMAIYAYNTTNFNDPRLKGYFGVDFQCGREVNKFDGVVSFKCGANTYSEAQMMNLPTQWSENWNINISEREPGYLYRNENGTAIYAANPRTNNSMMMRMWMNDPSLEHFEEVYGNTGVKVFKVV